MTKLNTLWISLVTLLVFLPALLAAGCRSTTPPATPETPDIFTSTWYLGQEGRKISLSGNSTGHLPGKQSEFLLKISNQSFTERWQDDRCILLLNKNGIVKEISHEKLDIPVGTETQEKIKVDFPPGIEGPLGLAIVLPQRGFNITTIWVGDNKTINAGPWPDIKDCPHSVIE